METYGDQIRLVNIVACRIQVVAGHMYYMGIIVSDEGKYSVYFIFYYLNSIGDIIFIIELDHYK